MRKFPMAIAILLAGALVSAISCSATPSLPASAQTTGIILARHDFAAADLSVAPDAITVGEYFRRFGTSSPVRMPNVPTQAMADFTVQMADGQRLSVTQAAVPELHPGVRAALHAVDGKNILQAMP